MRKGLVFTVCACLSLGVFFLLQPVVAQTLSQALPSTTLQQQVKPLVQTTTIPKLDRPALPDLVPVSCSFNIPSANPGAENVYLLVKYRNAGAANAVIPDRAYEWTAPCAQSGSATISLLNTSGSAAVMNPGGERFSNATSAYLSHLLPGTYTFTVKLDPNNLVAESNEANNEMTCTLTVITPDVDLRITTVTLSKQNPASTDNFCAYATVINGSKTTPLTIPAGTLMVSAAPFAQDAYQTTARVMQPGTTLTYMMRPTAAGRQKGTQTWTFTVDPANRFIERMETNNQATLPVTVN